MDFCNFRLFRKKKEPTDDQLVIDGNKARVLVESEAYTQAMAELEEKIWLQFVNTVGDAPEDREVLYTHLTALRLLHEQLLKSVQRGQDAQHILDNKHRS